MKYLITVLLTASFAVLCAQEPTTPPDNTKVNKKDRSTGEVTADQQKLNTTDQELTQKIRQSIVGDKSLSTYAHNIKIISRDGNVTLKGPVRSEEEKQNVIAKATAVTGSGDKITDQITVKPEKQ